MKRLVPVLLLAMALICGCSSSRAARKIDVVDLSSLNLEKKRVAVLPVRSQRPAIPDPTMGIKKELNKRIGKTVKQKLPEIEVIEQQDSYESMTDAGKIGLIDQLISGYNNNGAFDKRLIAMVCSTLNADYIVVPMLKVEQKDAIVAKAFDSSLEVALLTQSSSEPIWDGIGSYKKYGLPVVGDPESDEAAQELVNSTFGVLPPSK